MAGIRHRLFIEKAGLREIAAMKEGSIRTLATTAEQAVAVELGDADFVVPLAGLGGEMGSWAASLVARVAVLKGAAALAVVTTPFSAEGVGRRQVAEEALTSLRRHAHGVVAMPNDALLRIAPHLPLLKALDVMSRVVVQPVVDLLRVLTAEDLLALKVFLRRAVDWRLGIGTGRGDHPELAAVEGAFRSPWIRRDPRDARALLLVAVLPGADERRATAILEDINLRSPAADVLWGSFVDPGSEEFRVTVLVGF